MATYNPVLIDPATGDSISAVRWLLQDIPYDDGSAGELAAEVADEEVTALYASHPESLPQAVRVYRVAAACAQVLHRRYAKQASFSSDGTSVQLQERARYWGTIASELTTRSNLIENGADALVLYARRDITF